METKGHEKRTTSVQNGSQSCQSEAKTELKAPKVCQKATHQIKNNDVHSPYSAQRAFFLQIYGEHCEFLIQNRCPKSLKINAKTGIEKEHEIIKNNIFLMCKNIEIYCKHIRF